MPLKGLYAGSAEYMWDVRWEIADNRVGNNLQCSANNPAPAGGGNLVRGTKSDQCASL